MRVVVTGAGGYVGTALARRLAGDGHGVVAVVRRHSTALDHPRIVQQIVTDLARDAIRDEYWGGADALVHLAATVHHRGAGAPKFAQDARVAERVTLDACAHGVARVVFMSSAAVGGASSGELPLSEDVAPAPATQYATAKLAAEEIIATICAEAMVDAVTLRPPMIYGRGAPGNPAMLERVVRLARGLPLPLAIRTNRRSFISIGNVCAAITTALDARAGLSGRFYLSDGRDFSTAEFVERLAAALALPCNLFAVRPSFFRLGAELFGQRELASRLLDSFRIDDASFRSTFGWSSDASTEVVARAYAVDLPR